jgi:hypothetical protein
MNTLAIEVRALTEALRATGKWTGATVVDGP